MNLTALIVDDEYPCRETLKDLLLKYCPEISKVFTAQNIKEGIKSSQELSPDVVFLDINMPDGTGFDLLSQLSNYKFKVIFTTAFDDYAIKAFRYSAVDYLMKPISITELREAVAKCSLQSSFSNQVEAMQYYLKNQVFDKILVSTQDDYVFIEISEIITIEADGNYSLFKLKSGKKITVSRKIGEFEEMLAAHGFYRIHHSHIINFGYLQSIDKKDNEVIMKDGNRLLISSRKKSAFLKYCQQFGTV